MLPFAAFLLWDSSQECNFFMLSCCCHQFHNKLIVFLKRTFHFLSLKHLICCLNSIVNRIWVYEIYRLIFFNASCDFTILIMTQLKASHLISTLAISSVGKKKLPSLSVSLSQCCCFAVTVTASWTELKLGCASQRKATNSHSHICTN